jgi:hypothetical protein
MNHNKDNGQQLLAPLRALPEEFTLGQVQAFVTALPPRGSAAPGRSFFKHHLNLLCIAVASSLVAVWFLVQETPRKPIAQVPAPDNGQASTPVPNHGLAQETALPLPNNPVIVAASPFGNEGTHSLPAQDDTAQNNSQPAHKEVAAGMEFRSPHPGSSDTTASRTAEIHARASDSMMDARQSQHRQAPPQQMALLTDFHPDPIQQPASPPATRSANENFHVVVHTFDRKVIDYVCADADGVLPPAGEPEVTVRSVVVSVGGYNWHIVGGTPPYHVVSNRVDDFGNVCVSVRDSVGQVAVGCGLIGNMSERRPFHCNFNYSDSAYVPARSKKQRPNVGKPGPVSPPNKPVQPPPLRKDPSPAPQPPKGPGPEKPGPDPYRPPVRVVLTDPDPTPPPIGPLGRRPSTFTKPGNTPLPMPPPRDNDKRPTQVQRSYSTPSPARNPSGGNTSPSPQPRPSPVPVSPRKNKSW